MLGEVELFIKVSFGMPLSQKTLLTPFVYLIFVEPAQQLGLPDFEANPHVLVRQLAGVSLTALADGDFPLPEHASYHSLVFDEPRDGIEHRVYAGTLKITKKEVGNPPIFRGYEGRFFPGEEVYTVVVLADRNTSQFNRLVRDGEFSTLRTLPYPHLRQRELERRMWHIGTKNQFYVVRGNVEDDVSEFEGGIPVTPRKSTVLCYGAEHQHVLSFRLEIHNSS